jgi:hypothetical protein
MSEEAVAEQVEEKPQVEEQSEETQEAEGDSFMDQIFADLGVVQEETETAEETEEKNETDVVPEAEEAEASPEAEEGPGQTEEVEEEKEKPRKRVSYKAPKIDYEEIRRTVREEVSRQQPAPDPAPARQAVRELEDEAPADLVPEQMEELELARFAERRYPDKYQGQASKLLSFYKKLDDYAAKSDGSLDDDDVEFREFVGKNKPKLPNTKRLEREMIADLAAKQVGNEKDSVINDLKDKVRILETKPTIEKKFSTFTSDLQKAGEIEDDLAKPIYEQQLKSAENVGQEYLDLYYGMKTWDERNPTQKWIVDFVTHQSNYFARKGGKALEKGGKTFMTPADYSAHGKVVSNWTFGPDEILKMFNNFFTNNAKKQVESEYERLEKLGFTKPKGKKSSKSGKTKEDVRPITTPKAKTAQSPGAAESGDADDITFGEDLVKTLGMDFAPFSTG